MKAIVLAGGLGSRLYPATWGLSKQLLPVYDKPMVFYPLSVVMLSGIRDILLISQEEHLPQYQRMLGDGRRFGVTISYAKQDQPRGIADAFLVGRYFIGNHRVCLTLGDNIFYGQGLTAYLRKAAAPSSHATLFSYRVPNPSDFGVVCFSSDGRPLQIDEKPARPKSHFAITGLYFYPNDVVDLAGGLRPSSRGELEITDINSFYLSQNRLEVERLGRGIAWLDTGRPQSLLAASQFIETIEERQGIKIACLEEIAFNNGWISIDELSAAASAFKSSDYGNYLGDLCRAQPTNNFSGVTYISDQFRQAGDVPNKSCVTTGGPVIEDR